MTEFVSRRLKNGKRENAPFYRLWTRIRSKCHGKSFQNKWYKDRGIKVCKEWFDDFWTFQSWCNATYEKGKSLDRIDNDGDYSPTNCRWATQKEQMQNSRRRTEAKLNAAKTAFVASDKARVKKYGNPKTRTVKHCKICKKFKKLENFYKNKNNIDGVGSHCKPCNTIISRKYRVKNECYI